MTTEKTAKPKAAAAAAETTPAAPEAVQAGAAAAAPAPATKAEATIYMGPSHPRGLLMHGAMFLRGEQPEHVKKMAAECPALAALIVPVGRLSHVQQQLADRASMEAARVGGVRSYFNKEGG